MSAAADTCSACLVLHALGYPTPGECWCLPIFESVIKTVLVTAAHCIILHIVVVYCCFYGVESIECIEETFSYIESRHYCKRIVNVPRIVNQHSVVYCFKCVLCDSNYVGCTTRHLFQRIADHRYSAIGRHLRDAHGNIDLLNESQFRMLNKCSTKWDCLVYEMLYIRTIRPNLNTQSDSIRAKLLV